ncbi:hypothetical protein IGI04_002087 [Brassica rapa subsp. trilocularis]|uniref:Replication protein A 70 kDa DNA-binding subunit B/D first OB fold domain-containing protein n=1 Tax=Brassica rapa subsp. trilocularis TaxID=1813537 RepID=A0ABQ7NWR2_BRACM|nr:hypothetical protein IGI04_002087 [Brassica rapa subsp. trilocularis]
MAGFNPVADLKPFKSMWKIRVKIIRLWKQFTAAGGLTIEMVLIDANISFLATTRVKICEDLPRAINGFQPVNYREILDGTLNSDHLVDVIGQVVEVSHVDVLSVNGKDTQKITLELRDLEDVRLPLVLWGNFASDVSNAMQTRRDEALICVLRFGKIKVWKDDRSISNAYNVSDVSLNPYMTEVEEFKSKLPKDELCLAIVESKPVGQVVGVSDKDDFFVHTRRKTIAELSESRQVEKCIVMCTIAAIDADMGWYYLSCKVCSKKVVQVPNDTLDDGEDENELMFNVIPLELQNLVGKTYLFKIQIERENYVYKHETYKVLKIVTNLEMISEFNLPASPKVPRLCLGSSTSALSEAPEGSLMLSAGSSEEVNPSELTPAKRRVATIVNLEEDFDRNSVTKTACTVRVKKEKIEKSEKKMNRNKHKAGKENVTDNRPPKRRKLDTRSSTNSVDMVQPEDKRAMLGEITNQASNEQRDARTKRFNILQQKRKFSETNPTPTKPKQLNIEPSFQLSAASESSENHSIIETHIATASIGHPPKKRIQRHQEHIHEGFKFTAKGTTQPAASFFKNNSRGTSTVSHCTVATTQPTLTGPTRQFPCKFSSQRTAPQPSSQNHDCSEGNWANTSDEDHNDDILSDTDTDDEQIDIVQRRAVTNQVFERFARAFGDSLTKAKPRSTASIVSAKKEEEHVNTAGGSVDTARVSSGVNADGQTVGGNTDGEAVEPTVDEIKKYFDARYIMLTYACLTALVPGKKQPAIRVKIVRTWMSPFGSIRPNTCMVFGDEKVSTLFTN